jgi:ATP/maltotriose-dependent transcriptional regulator MalT
VLHLALQEGLCREFACRLLTLMGEPAKPAPVRVPGSGDILSAREVELLRLMASGASNRAIASQLVISDQTVKTHVAHILRKLDATSRSQAVARARELHLL